MLELKLLDELVRKFFELEYNNIVFYKNTDILVYFDEKKWNNLSPSYFGNVLLNYYSENMELGPKKNEIINILQSSNYIVSIFYHFKKSYLRHIHIGEAIFDVQHHLLGFCNGVMDLNKGDFRPYTNKDYITIKTGYDWNEPTQKDMAEMLLILIKLFPKKLEKVLRDIKKILYGYKNNFYFFNGIYSSGKSTFIDIISKSLGNYCEFLPHEPDPFENIKFCAEQKRLTVFSEPDLPKCILGGCDIEIKKDDIIKRSYIFLNTFHGNITNIPKDQIFDINFNSSFQNIDLKDEIKTEDKYVVKADPQLREKIQDPKYLCAFIRILLNA